MIRGAKIALGIAAAAFACSGALAADDIKIGAIYDLTGPFAGGGSKPASIGNKIAIDMINERGGVEGHKVVGIFVDATGGAGMVTHRLGEISARRESDGDAVSHVRMALEPVGDGR